MPRVVRWLGVAALATVVCCGIATAAVGRDVAAGCAACHGTDGRSRGSVPSLAGRDKDELVRAMRELRDGRRPSTIMPQLLQGYTDAELDAAAAYFAAQKAP